MNRRQAAAVAVLSAVALTVVGAAPAIAGNGGDGLEWKYHEDGDGYYRPPQGESPDDGGGPSGPPPTDEDGYWSKIEIGATEEDGSDSYEWFCDGSGSPESNTGDSKDGVCENTSGEGDADSWGSVVCHPKKRPQFPNIELQQHEKWHGGKWPKYDGEWDFVDKPLDEQCVEVGDDDWVSTEEITEDIDYSVFQKLDSPSIKIAPTAKGYVNLPVIAYTDYYQSGDLPGPGRIVDRDPLTVEIPVDVEKPGENLTGEITATAELTWSFEGSDDVQKGLGEPYTPSVDPVHDPGAEDYYVDHIFRSKGTKTITLNVRWTGKVEVDGLDPEDIDPIDLPAATTQVPVEELTPVLGR